MFEPNDADAGNAFISSIIDDAFPKEFVFGVVEGIKSVIEASILAGLPIVDLRSTMVNGAFHNDDSCFFTFEIAARTATREAIRNGHWVLLEPIMKVEVATPQEYTGTIIGDLKSRRGEIQSQEMQAGTTVISAMTPLANMP
jgi:elongation factor G